MDCKQEEMLNKQQLIADSLVSKMLGAQSEGEIEMVEKNYDDEQQCKMRYFHSNGVGNTVKKMRKMRNSIHSSNTLTAVCQQLRRRNFPSAICETIATKSITNNESHSSTNPSTAVRHRKGHAATQRAPMFGFRRPPRVAGKWPASSANGSTSLRALGLLVAVCLAAGHLLIVAQAADSQAQSQSESQFQAGPEGAPTLARPQAASNERRSDEAEQSQSSGGKPAGEEASKSSEQSSIVASLSSAVASAAAAAAVAAAQTHAGLATSDARSLLGSSGTAANSQQHHAGHPHRSPGLHLAIKLADSIPEVPYNILHNMKKLDHAAPFYNVPAKLAGKESPSSSASASASSSAASSMGSLLGSALLSVASGGAHQHHHNRLGGVAAEQIGQLFRSPLWKRLAEGYDGFASEFRSLFKPAGGAHHHNHQHQTKYHAHGLVQPAKGPVSSTSKLLRDISVPALLMLLASSLSSGGADWRPVRTRRKSQPLLAAPQLSLSSSSSSSSDSDSLASAASSLFAHQAPPPPSMLEQPFRPSAAPNGGPLGLDLGGQQQPAAAARQEHMEAVNYLAAGAPFGAQPAISWNRPPAAAASPSEQQQQQAHERMQEQQASSLGHSSFGNQLLFGGNAEPASAAASLLAGNSLAQLQQQQQQQQQQSPMQLMQQSFQQQQANAFPLPIGMASKRLGEHHQFGQPQHLLAAEPGEQAPPETTFEKRSDDSAAPKAKQTTGNSLSRLLHLESPKGVPSSGQAVGSGTGPGSWAAMSTPLATRIAKSPLALIAANGDSLQKRASDSQQTSGNFLAKQLELARRLLLNSLPAMQEAHLHFGDATGELAHTRRQQQGLARSGQTVAAEQRDLTKLLPESWREVVKRTMSTVQQQANTQWKAVEGQLATWVQEKLKSAANQASPGPLASAASPASSSSSSSGTGTASSPTNASLPKMSNIIASVSSTALNILGLNGGNKQAAANVQTAGASAQQTDRSSPAAPADQQPAASGPSAAASSSTSSRGKPLTDSKLATSRPAPSNAAAVSKPTRTLVAGVASMLAQSIGSNSRSPSSSSQSHSSPSYTIISSNENTKPDEGPHQSVASHYPTMNKADQETRTGASGPQAGGPESSQLPKVDQSSSGQSSSGASTTTTTAQPSRPLDAK